MTDQADLQALSDAATPADMRDPAQAHAYQRGFAAGRAATPVVPAEGLREAIEALDTFRVSDDLGSRTMLDREDVLSLLAASPSPDTDREEYPALLQIDGGSRRGLRMDPNPLIRELVAGIIQVAALLALTVLACFTVGWCLGWVVVGFRAVAG